MMPATLIAIKKKNGWEASAELTEKYSITYVCRMLQT
jgi:hypothetical protein